MGLIKQYRPNGLEVTLDDDSVVKIMMIRNNPRHGVVARVKGEGRKILWDSDNAEAHKDDTDQQFIDRLKVIY